MKRESRFKKLEHYPAEGILLKNKNSDEERFCRLEISECKIEKRVEKTEEKKEEKAELRSWQVKCLGCGRPRPRLSRCVYCGWDDDSSAAIKDEIVLTVDGKVYRSSDADVPLHIRRLMSEIRKKGNTPEVIDGWMKRYNAEKDMKEGLAESEIDRLRNEVFRRALMVIGIVVIVVISVIVRMR